MQGVINLFVLFCLTVIVHCGSFSTTHAQSQTDLTQNQAVGNKGKSGEETETTDNKPPTSKATQNDESASSGAALDGQTEKEQAKSTNEVAEKNTGGSPIIAAIREKNKSLKPQIEQILKFYFKQKENSASRSPWGIMHAMIAFGPYAEMYGDGKLVKDVDWLCQNGRGRAWRLMKLNNGRLSTNNGPGMQGHDGQFLAILAQSQIDRSKTLTVEGKQFTIEDLILYEKRTCKPGKELTFKLIGLSHYIDSDAKWRSGDGRIWSLERVIREELKQPINGAACGGTHRLMGYSYSLLMRKLQNKPITGQWKRAEEFVDGFRDYAMSMQNRDGSFSTDWFKQRQAKLDSQRRVQTTGHILEWLVFSATEKELADPRLARSVDYLAKLMWNERSTEWEVGPKGHAIRALRLFYERVFAGASNNVATARKLLLGEESETQKR